MSDAVFRATGEGRFIASELARGPWDPGSQHGGAPAALLVRQFELACRDHHDDLLLARITFEFLRPVPLGELHAQTRVARPGRRVQLLEGSLSDRAGTELVRARALRIARAALSGGVDADDAPATGGPEQGRANDYPRGADRMFATDAMEIRFVSGAFLELGPATAWFRLRVPLVDDEQPSALQRLAAAGDFGNGISAALTWDRHLFINPDLTLYVEREPLGEWICLQSETRVSPGGVGIAESVLSDSRGRVGRAVQALLVARR